ncbi:helix-turn-helix transcriptional regulator [Streptomyces sp. Z26]|uniref:helix-turn-helix transcriptional regulator n=1 Tax=Streptomyces sp. Z26 TaxID=2500177 RepID=UPI000EF15103|nr:helix-turn-helix transcriptional regulator [Streptomyces sp. Z26]RLL67019.1 XRE family transcriptional regulator [Streptomyces sp. Z26]
MPAPAEPPSARTLAVRQQIGRNIAAARLEANLTQEGLAERAGVSRDTIYRIETGVRAGRIDWYIAIAHALEADLAELVRSGRPLT